MIASPLRALLCALLCVLAAAPLAAQSRTVVVRAVTEAERAPLGYAVVSAPDLDIERFANSAGLATLQVTGDRVKLRVKRLGFTPKDTTVQLADGTNTVVVALARVTYRLREVRVVGFPACTEPGVREAQDRELFVIVEQLRENAERFRLAVKQYPFVYTMEREFGYKAADSSYIAEARDVIAVNGAPAWTYRPGTLVTRELGIREWVMHIPSLGDLAEDAWIENHCFHLAGMDDRMGERLLRIDIIAAEKLKSVDANATVWLDSADFRLRFASFSLNKPPPQVRNVLASTARVRYRELIPFVPVMDLLVAENTVQYTRPRREVRVQIEQQEIQSLFYKGARPDSLRRDSLP